MRNKPFLIALLLSLIILFISANKTLAASGNIDQYRVAGQTTYVYAKNQQRLSGHQRRPLVLFMHGTGGEPQTEARTSGWTKLAAKHNVIVISPEYDDYATYANVDYLTKVVRRAIKRYPIDPQRVYTVGFSNGGATSVALVSKHPEMYAGMAAYGWSVAMQQPKAGYTIPFQFIQGTNEATEQSRAGNPMVRADVRQTVRSLLRYNQMISKQSEADYQQTPYWGYQPDSTSRKQLGQRTWTLNNYQKSGYQAPFAQFILVAPADHRPHLNDATYSWKFLQKFARNDAGQIVEN